MTNWQIQRITPRFTLRSLLIAAAAICLVLIGIDTLIHKPWEKAEFIRLCKDADALEIEFYRIRGNEKVVLAGEPKAEFCNILTRALKKEPLWPRRFSSPYGIGYRAPTTGREPLFVRLCFKNETSSRFRLQMHGSSSYALRISDFFQRHKSEPLTEFSVDEKLTIIRGFSVDVDSFSK